MADDIWVEKRSFWSRWRQGVRELTPLQLLRAKRVGYAGQVFGMLLAMGFLAVNGLSYFLVFLFFVLVVLVVELVKVHQQVRRIESYG